MAGWRIERRDGVEEWRLSASTQRESVARAVLRELKRRLACELRLVAPDGSVVAIAEPSRSERPQ